MISMKKKRTKKMTNEKSLHDVKVDVVYKNVKNVEMMNDLSEF